MGIPQTTSANRPTITSNIAPYIGGLYIPLYSVYISVGNFPQPGQARRSLGKNFFQNKIACQPRIKNHLARYLSEKIIKINLVCGSLSAIL